MGNDGGLPFPLGMEIARTSAPPELAENRTNKDNKLSQTKSCQHTHLMVPRRFGGNMSSPSLSRGAIVVKPHLSNGLSKHKMGRDSRRSEVPTIVKWDVSRRINTYTTDEEREGGGNEIQIRY